MLISLASPIEPFIKSTEFKFWKIQSWKLLLAGERLNFQLIMFTFLFLLLAKRKKELKADKDLNFTVSCSLKYTNIAPNYF